KAPRGSRAPWVLGGAGNALWFAGDALSASFDYGTTGIGSLLTPADGLYLLGYPVLTAAVLLARRTRGPARDRGVALDAAMLIVAAALPIYEFWMRTALEHPAGGTLAIIVNAAYPALDMVLLAAGIRLAAGLRGSSAIVALLGVGLLFNVVADAVYNVQTINGGYSLGSALDIGWLVGYLLWGIAALLPASPRAAPPSVPDDEAPYRRRAILLGLLVASPLSVIAAAYRGAYALDAVAVLGTLVVMIIVASIRLRDLARSGSPRWRTSAFMHGGGVVVVILAMAVTHAQSISKRRADSTLALTHTQTLVEHLQSVEDGIHAGEVSVEQGRTAFVASVADVKRALETRDPDTLAANGGGGLQRDLTDYATHAELLFDLIGRDRLNAALRMDELRVSPAYQRLEAELDRTVRSYRRSATSTAEVERTVTITLLLGGAILLMWLFRRFTATRREIERTEARARALGDSERRFAALVAGSADMLTVVDADTRVLAYPDTVERVLGKEAGSMLGARLDAELDETDTRRTRDLLDRLRHDAEASGTVDWHLTRADGSPMTAEARLTNQLDDPLLCGFVLNVRDVTARADLERELEFRAYHDHLTGLANRSQLEARLRHALTRSARSLALHAIVVINLDDFKSINDSFGHAAGDALLIEVGRRLRMRMRSNDTVARLGGDEFGILLEDVPSIDEALAATRRMLEGLRVPYEFAGRTVLVGGSAGVAVTDGAATGSIEEAAERQLRNADLAMYEAKRVGDGSVELFAPEMHVAVASRVELRAAIKKGLERGEFLLHYQPIIEFANRKIVGYEALVRWERPGHGLVPPDEFIPIAEQTGLIVELGTFVLGEATRQLAAWNARADE
ncbi:MAG: hypothetical protein QOI80_2626, partial [Solirubrobacteraceae bacterium]|nr:hypothetical protein [Solirubrobacteraceae bacterium]